MVYKKRGIALPVFDTSFHVYLIRLRLQEIEIFLMAFSATYMPETNQIHPAAIFCPVLVCFYVNVLNIFCGI